jgi:hypothetical protein
MTRRTEPSPRTDDQAQERVRRRLSRNDNHERSKYDSDRVQVTNDLGELALAVSTTATVFYHQLGRIPTAFKWFNPNADVRVWFTASDSESITLDASATATIAAEVY